MASVRGHKQRKWINMVYFYFLCLSPLRFFTALFTNMRILRLKTQLTIAFFAAVNHLNGPLRKQNFTLAGSKGHGLWFVIGGFRSVLCVSVFQGSLLVIVTVIDGSEKRNYEGRFWTLEFACLTSLSCWILIHRKWPIVLYRTSIRHGVL